MSLSLPSLAEPTAKSAIASSTVHACFCFGASACCTVMGWPMEPRGTRSLRGQLRSERDPKAVGAAPALPSLSPSGSVELVPAAFAANTPPVWSAALVSTMSRSEIRSFQRWGQFKYGSGGSGADAPWQALTSIVNALSCSDARGSGVEPPVHCMASDVAPEALRSLQCNYPLRVLYHGDDITEVVLTDGARSFGCPPSAPGCCRLTPRAPRAQARDQWYQSNSSETVQRRR